MRLADVLKLPKQPHSLSIIKDFLEQPLSHTDYQAAFSYYFDICLSLEAYDQVFQEGTKVLKEIELQVETPYYEKILKAMIDASFHLSKLDEMKTYIQLRKEKLPILKQYLGLLDDIMYKKALQLPYLDDVLRILKDVIPTDTKIFCHQELFYIYKHDAQHEMALNQIYELYNYDLKHQYIYDELDLLLKLNRFDEVIQKALKELRDHPKEIKCLRPLITAYLQKEDYHKASTLQAEYDDQIEDADDETKKSLYELFVILYQKMDHKPSVDFYSKKLKTIQKTLEKKAPQKVDIEKPKEEKIVFVEKVPEKTLSHPKMLEDLERAQDLIVFAHLIDDKLPLREYLRQFFIEEEIKFVYAFPLGDIGVFLIHIEEEIKDPGIHYDFLKLISSILFGHLLDEKKLSKMKEENRFYQSALNAPILSYRELSEHQSTYNESAQKLFRIDSHHHLELFLRDLSYEHVSLYKETIQRLLNKSGETKELRYRYQEKHILEKLYGLKIGDEHIVMSLFFDETAGVSEVKQLLDQATSDPETDLGNRYLFSQESEKYLKDKASFLLIELDEQLKHIYGHEQMKKYFKEFAQHTKKFFSEGETYRYDFNQLLVVLPVNDIRSVTKSVKDYLRYLEVYESKVLTYERFNVNIGILRYPVVTIEKSMEKILRFLDIALERAKRDKEDKYVFFVYRDYEDELFEQQVIDHLNIAIEERSLGLVFNQLTDIKKNRVWQYESELALLNLSIDNKYLMAIAKKRHRLADLERFHMN